MGEEGVNVGWSLLRKRMRFVVGTGGEGAGAVVKHLLGQMMRVGGGLDPQVGEHGIGLPAAEDIGEGVSGKLPLTKDPFPNLPIIRNPHCVGFGLLGAQSHIMLGLN